MNTPPAITDDQGRFAAAHGSASEVERIYREHLAIAASYEAQRDTINGSGLPYGPCQCSVCAEWKRLNRKINGPVASKTARSGFRW